jgi:hypothetical protein
MVGAFMVMAVSVGAEGTLDGFLQGLCGARLDKTNPTATEWTASENRLQLRAEHFGDAGEFFGRLDFVYDGADESSYDWELREGYLKFRLGSRVDLKAGRQILTWGTGDLIFINDVFAKDYLSFFVGRDDQYLKAPQNALRTDVYTGMGALSLVWSPRFEPNRLPTGRKLSYYDGQQIVGESSFFDPPVPEPELSNSELAVRFNRSVGSFATALYFYRGFYKNPTGVRTVLVDTQTVMVPVYPALNVYGASIRGALMGGIVWLEGGYFDSRSDREGDNPFMPNSQITAMVGFERQVATNLTLNAQWQIDKMLDHSTYEAQSETGGLHVRDEVRHLVTSRVTKLLADELLTLSAFGFFSPTDEDGYLQLSASYKYSDEISLAAGGNLFAGQDDATEFGQFQKNDNVYMKLTYGF